MWLRLKHTPSPSLRKVCARLLHKWLPRLSWSGDQMLIFVSLDSTDCWLEGLGSGIQATSQFPCGRGLSLVQLLCLPEKGSTRTELIVLTRQLGRSRHTWSAMHDEPTLCVHRTLDWGQEAQCHLIQLNLHLQFHSFPHLVFENELPIS